MAHIMELLAPLARERAYLDPGSGSILLQMVIAAALGAAFAVKVYWKKIKGALSKKRNENEISAAEESPEQKPDEKS